ncbi:tumor necrosis factor receptor superfamily member 11B-like [Labeo rohita]|uniref:tumor necrosis factor receptor superfamily member 11B-like n=1 Tax=Labeo rohita TaxID=84645 RepID=UPI0021E20F97|nr:tumor necrosis factor receptor superfamily member 11B-like [Labeo rohita]
MFLLCSVCFLLVSALSGANGEEEYTYWRTDPVTRQQLLCNRCPPGSRLRAHCTRSSQTECAPCGAGLFTEFWNYIPDCLRCDTCSDHQTMRVVRPCNGSVNTLCECKAGFYWDEHFCRRHSTCKPGHGVKASGTPHKDTVCELCADGHFADVTQENTTCVTHSACEDHKLLLLPGSRWHDSVCATCDHHDHTPKGWEDLFKPVLSGLHVQFGIPIERMQKLVNRRLRRGSGRRNGKRAAPQHLQRNDGTSEEELLNLPSILEETHQSLLADRIARKILRFQQHCRSREL